MERRIVGSTILWVCVMVNELLGTSDDLVMLCKGKLGDSTQSFQTSLVNAVLLGDLGNS